MIRLVVNGESFDGWLSAEIERSLDEFAQRFSLRVLPDNPITVAMGDFCSVYSDDDLLITGYVNRVSIRVTSDDYVVSIEGRSTTGDLVDCSAIHETGHWSGKTGNQIASDLCVPFGISVTGVASDPFEAFALEPGESVHDALDRLGKVRGLLPVTRATGQVQLLRVTDTRPTDEQLDLSRCIQRSVMYDESERHSEYRLRAVGSGKNVAAVALDPEVLRYRPLVVISDAPADTAKAKVRAQWEANIRAGRSERVHYALIGVNTAECGTIFPVWDNILGIDEQLVLTRSTIRSNQQELITEFELCRPETYSVLEYPKTLLTGRKKSGKQIVHKTRHT